MNSNIGNSMSENELKKVSGGLGDEIDTQNISIFGSATGLKQYPKEQSCCPECGSKVIRYINLSDGKGTVMGQACDKGHSWTFKQ